MGLNKKIKQTIKNMPKYTINPEVFESQNIARSQAFGRDRDVQMAQEDINQGVAAGIGQAKDVTSSTSALLSAITDLNLGAFDAKRSLAGTEAGLRRDKIRDLYGVNEMVGEEKDKAFMQNKIQPWEAKLRMLTQKKQNRAAIAGTITQGLLTAAGAIVGGPIGAGIGSKIGGNINQAIAKSGDIGQVNNNNWLNSSINGQYAPYLDFVGTLPNNAG